MVSRSVIILFVVVSLLFSQVEVQENLFKWIYPVEAGDAVIIAKSLKWLEVPTENLAIRVLSNPEDQFIMFCQGSILIPRYGSGELIEAEFDLKIKGENQILFVEMISLEVSLHEIITDEYVKKQEIKMIEKRLKQYSDKLAQFIINSEMEFIQYFDKGDE